MTKIVLSWLEVVLAAQAGVARQLESVRSGRKPRFPPQYPGQLLANHVNAAIAECAAAKFLGVYWTPSVNQFHVPDLERLGVEVRYSTREDLKVRHDEHDAIIMSITGDPFGEMYMAGWCYGYDAIKDQYRRDFGNRGAPAYFIPHSQLQPPGSLRDVLCLS